MATQVNHSDDAMLNNFLDDLILSARNDVDTRNIDATTSHHDVVFTPDTLHDGINAVNSLLATTGIPLLPNLVAGSRRPPLPPSNGLPPLPPPPGKDPMLPPSSQHNLQPNNNRSTIQDQRQENVNNSNIAESHKVKPVVASHSKSSNVQTVLAAALSALVRICRANGANLDLRQRAEARTLELEAELASARKSNNSLRTRAESAKDSAAAAKRKADSMTRERDNLTRKHAAETTELRARLQTAISREKSLVQKLQQRDKEGALLKQRVLTLIENPRGTPMLQRITSARSVVSGMASGSPKKGKTRAGLDLRKDTSSKEKSVINARTEIIEDENQTFRSLLRAIQEELDDLVVICPEHPSDEHSTADDNHEAQNEDGEARENEEDTDEEGEETTDGADFSTPRMTLQHKRSYDGLSAHDIPPAPTEEQMRMPFELIREDFEESLERKFLFVRNALSSIESV